MRGWGALLLVGTHVLLLLGVTPSHLLHGAQVLPSSHQPSQELVCLRSFMTSLRLT